MCFKDVEGHPRSVSSVHCFWLQGIAAKDHKGPYQFDKLRLVQDMSGEHRGPVWTTKFSLCGRLLATGGQDTVVRVWVLKESFSYFDDMRKKFNESKYCPVKFLLAFDTRVIFKIVKRILRVLSSLQCKILLCLESPMRRKVLS